MVGSGTRKARRGPGGLQPRGRESPRPASRRSRSVARFLAVVMIQPAGLGGRPGEGPVPDGEREGFLDGVLGGVDFPEDAGQDGDGPPVLLPEDAGNVRLRRRSPGGHWRPGVFRRRRRRCFADHPGRA
ncbi:hypothetical protein [Arthrobacter sp. AL12]|uniref:hypothetical protein n=1 Tax=Arthrobacter sp. AL12 TaxID=3042241 RepID=UPI0032B7CF52